MTNKSRSTKHRSIGARSIAVLLCLACWACDPDRVYEQYHDIPKNQWYIDSVQRFTFEIADPAVPYNIHYNIRNAVSYPYYNLFVTYYLTDGAGKQLSSRLQELTLMDAQTGKPLGDGLGDIFDHQVISLPNYRFPAKGKYTFAIRQYMRKDPLPDIMSVGIRVEKAR
ncbi:MAG: gliding motility lipoprotein GldH [Cytophagales bacterium]|jgi:gliding motility-associated lipoprotein GldH|nr:gliding motility lipoprotein GldH [Cytophagales bacterium]